MANSLTGDFEAVLQVSAGTLRRLVANMHQNAFANPANPSIPHVVYLRLEDDPVPGQRGSIAAQIGAPYLQLIHGATDRFRIEFGIRARYRADPGTVPLVDLIHGTVRADYRRQDIDPNCLGWRGIADEYFWFRVVKDSVSFEGTVLNESSAIVLTKLLDEPQVLAHLNQHLAAILAKQFEPEPQRVDKRLQRIRCLEMGGGPSDSAIAIPHGLSANNPAGNLASIERIFLNGHDLALAVSAAAITSRVQPFLDPLVGFQVNAHYEIDAGFGGGLIVDYRVRIDTAAVEWLGSAAIPLFPGGGLMRVRLTGVGWASRLYRSGVLNVGSVHASDLGTTFTIDQYLRLTFNPTTEFLSVGALGVPIVDIRGGSLAGFVIGPARDAILKGAQSQLAGPLAAAQEQLDAMGVKESLGALVKALKNLDVATDAHFVSATFDADGVALCGSVSLTHRHRPQVAFIRRPEGDGFDSIESWIPGGRIDRFSWTWKWFTGLIERPPGPPGAATAEETFVLLRPPESRTQFGLALARDKPLPGLDGNGKLCLTVSGKHVDPFTGILVPVTSTIECVQFNYEFHMPYEVGPYLRVCDPLQPRDGDAVEIGVLRVGVSETQTASNTLVVYLREHLDDETVEVLERGLGASRPEGAGLLVVLVFGEGALARDRNALQSHIDSLRKHLPAPLLVTDDVRAGWSTALTISSQGSPISWRLVSPAGVVRWAHDGRVDSDILTRMLDTRLVASGPPAFSPVRTGIEPGHEFSIGLVHPECPPAPLGRDAGSKVLFVAKDAASARATLQRIRYRAGGANDDDRPYVAVIVEGADACEIDALKNDLQLDVPMFPDPLGALTRRAGIRFSPTTLMLDHRGVVTGVEMADGDRTNDSDSRTRAD